MEIQTSCISTDLLFLGLKSSALEVQNVPPGRRSGFGSSSAVREADILLFYSLVFQTRGLCQMSIIAARQSSVSADLEMEPRFL